MATGWFQVGDVWYWADVSGAMATSTRVDGYWVDADGKWVPGA